MSSLENADSENAHRRHERRAVDRDQVCRKDEFCRRGEAPKSQSSSTKAPVCVTVGKKGSFAVSQRILRRACCRVVEPRFLKVFSQC
jgi:hypothetical protein